MDDLAKLTKLAQLIKAKNPIDNFIAELIEYPAQIGHVGEYIAAKIFGIDLHELRTHKSSDGHFRGGSLDGQTVNVKWYPKRERTLDMKPDNDLDYYLVLTGPESPASSSRGKSRPWVIETVFLFDAHELIRKLTDASLAKGKILKLNEASGIPLLYWNEAEIYPSQKNDKLVLTDEQRKQLALFQPIKIGEMYI